jgi:predicted nucleic acid-binding Zn ribbon protein
VEQVQAACDNCGAGIAANAAYCDKCGARTRRARRLVRLAIRVELLFFLLVVGIVVGFTWIYSAQR